MQYDGSLDKEEKRISFSKYKKISTNPTSSQKRIEIKILK